MKLKSMLRIGLRFPKLAMKADLIEQIVGS